MGQSDLQKYAVIRKIILIFFWFETVSEDEIVSEDDVLNLSRTISLKDMKFFSWNLFIIVHG